MSKSRTLSRFTKSSTESRKMYFSAATGRWWQSMMGSFSLYVTSCCHVVQFKISDELIQHESVLSHDVTVWRQISSGSTELMRSLWRAHYCPWGRGAGVDVSVWNRTPTPPVLDRHVFPAVVNSISSRWRVWERQSHVAEEEEVVKEAGEREEEEVLPTGGHCCTTVSHVSVRLWD